MEEGFRLTFNQWNAIQPRGVLVLDPDGWDRRDPEFHTKTYTLQEFLSRAMRSTVIVKPGRDAWRGIE